MQQAQVLLRGLRAVSDFEIELQMAHTNKTLSTQIETVFLATSNEYSFLSSSVVKEIARFGGSVDHLVPPHIALDIYQCYNQKSLASNPTTNSASPSRFRFKVPMRETVFRCRSIPLWHKRAHRRPLAVAFDKSMYSAH